MDRTQHGRKIFIAILQQRDLVARERDGICESERGTEELRVAYRKRVIESVLEHLAPDEEKAENHYDSDECEHQRDPFAEGDVPPFGV